MQLPIVPISFLALALAVPASAEWPMWGRTPSRNMEGPAKNLPVEINVGDINDETEEADLSDAKNVRWAVKIGSQAYGNPAVGAGKVFVGTNNESPRDPKILGDRGVMMCFDEKTGSFLWQLIVPKLGARKVSDWEYVGICSSPVIEKDRVWIVTNRGEVVCLDIDGLADGNDGPFKDEADFMTDKNVGPGQTPVVPELNDQHADILWIFDMREELGVFPHNVSSCSPLIVGDTLYTATSNGVDWSHTNIPAPLGPGLVAIDKNTGKLLGEEISGVSDRVLHASWSSPAYGSVKGKNLVVWGGGDGFAYAFDPKPVLDKEEGIEILKEVWRYDANPPEYRKKDGEPIKYATYRGPSEIIGTTVLYKDHVYAIIGQDPEHGDGVGMLSCIDASMTGDLTGKAVWTYTDVGRSISTPSIVDDLVYVAEYDGDVHCVDAKTGKPYWVHETGSRIWASTLVADGKVWVATEDGEVVILAAGKEAKHLGTADFMAPIYSSPIVANDTLYVGTQTHLYAVGKK
ncbi:MAG: PQQ-binding-like beta-propeller repeat protein [Akkermansiaceae bacterium]|nr:PQQ-binding-like beta-propeller repeat protein [Akkermansiaceae bacterium]NNM28464.1 PQQ-binding-like beta-propeller repeat protein [Akkermansiaceae bacterium]